jgi:hypothetical protein
MPIGNADNNKVGDLLEYDKDGEAKIPDSEVLSEW